MAPSRSSKSFAISKSSLASQCHPNILPCHINYSGPANASSRYWKSVHDTDGTKTAYFRGRKLRGKMLVIPEGYRGAVLKETDRVVRASEPVDREEEEEEGDEVGGEEKNEYTEMEEVAEFDRVTVWGHEIAPDDADNPYVKGIEEWISFAKAIHSYEDAPGKEK